MASHTMFSHIRNIIPGVLLLQLFIGFCNAGEAMVPSPYSTAKVRTYEPTPLTYRQQPIYSSPQQPTSTLNDGYIKYLAKSALQRDLSKINSGLNNLEKCCSDTKTNITLLRKELQAKTSPPNICPKYFIQYRVTPNYDLLNFSPFLFKIEILEKSGFVTLSNDNLFARIPAGSQHVVGTFFVDTQLICPWWVLLSPLNVPNRFADALNTIFTNLLGIVPGNQFTNPINALRASAVPITNIQSVRTLMAGEVRRVQNTPSFQRDVQTMFTRQSGSTSNTNNRNKRTINLISQFGTTGHPLLTSQTTLKIRTDKETFMLMPDILTWSSLVYWMYSQGLIINGRIFLYECQPIPASSVYHERTVTEDGENEEDILHEDYDEE